jgi:phage host-nuclease inhibitor protein Gam
MNNKRQKVVLMPTTITKQEAEIAFADYNDAEAKHQMINNEIEQAILRIRQRYAHELEDLTATKAETFAILLAYAENNRADFGKKKSMEMANGIIGFRTGTPSLKTAKGYTWNSVTTMLAMHYPQYIREVKEPAKDKILAERYLPENQTMLKQCGMLVTQTETFFVEPQPQMVLV